MNSLSSSFKSRFESDFINGFNEQNSKFMSDDRKHFKRLVKLKESPQNKVGDINSMSKLRNDMSPMLLVDLMANRSFRPRSNFSNSSK